MLDINDKQSIYDAIQSAKGDSKALWALVGNINKQHTTAIKIQAKELTDTKTTKTKDGLDFSSLLDDKDKLRAHVLEDLFKGSQAGNSQASDKLAKLAGLDVAEQDLKINLVDYKEVLIDCPHCGENLRKPAQDAVECPVLDGNA